MVFIIYREGWKIKMKYHFDEKLTRYWLICAGIYFTYQSMFGAMVCGNSTFLQ
jgi:hypothetical protein